MKKLVYLLLACVLCSALALTACSGDSQEQPSDEGVEAEVTQTDVEENIVGTWMKSEEDGQPVLTDDKLVLDIVSPDKAFSSISRDAGQNPWHDNEKSKIEIENNVMTITTSAEDESEIVDEYTITGINENEFTAIRKGTSTLKGSEPDVMESEVTFIRVNDDFSDDILGTWEGHCTSEGSAFDDGQEHRWEYKDDGTYVYYVKDGDKWVPSDDTMNEYFVAGNLLCARWMDKGEEYREWWDISIDGDTMNWTALRADEDGKTFTVTFEMKKVEE